MKLEGIVTVKYVRTALMLMVCMVLFAGCAEESAKTEKTAAVADNADVNVNIEEEAPVFDGINRLIVHAQQEGDTIAPEIYGQFAEHLGRCVYEGFWVGEDSDIPNVRGIRTDVVQALKKLNIPVLRWPGGCFADEYHWQDGIGPKDQRPKMVNTHWGMVTDDNSFGTHEFLDLCEMLGCQAYIAGNVGSGTVEELQDWIEYMTFDGDSEMANLRRANGRQEPWKIKYVGVGNESWGCGGNMTPGYYSDLYKRYQTYVREYPGSEITKVASGPGGEDFNWIEVILKEIGGRMDAYGQHYYVRGTGSWDEGKKGSATEFDEKEWFVLMDNTLKVDRIIRKNKELLEKYDRRGDIDLYVDEWGTWWDEEEGTKGGFLYQQNTLRDAVSCGIFLNEFNKHCDRVKMCNIAQINNVLQAMILTDGPRMIVTPTYYVFEMFKEHQGAKLVKTDLVCDDYKFDGKKLPALHVSASKNEAGAMTITICNLDPSSPAELECKIDGIDVQSVEGRVLTSDKMNTHNTFENPEAIEPVKLKGIVVNGDMITVSLPAKSVSVIQVN